MKAAGTRCADETFERCVELSDEHKKICLTGTVTNRGIDRAEKRDTHECWYS